MRKADTASKSGVCFIGSPLEPFHMILRIPVHVFCVVKKCFEIWENPVPVSFYSGSMPITDLALPKFCGTFLYREKNTKKIKRFQAAFVYPISSDRLDLSDFDKMIGSLVKLLQSLDYGNFEYFDKQNKSLKTIISENFVNASVLPPFDLEDLLCSSCCLPADKII